MDNDDEMKKAKMAAAEIAFYLQSDFDDDTCTLASLQSDLSKISIRSSQQSRVQKPGAYWTPRDQEAPATNIPEETKEEGEFDMESTPPRGSRLSAPQPADPQESFASRRRKTISEARRTCQRVEKLLEGTFDGLDRDNSQAQIPSESTHSSTSGATNPSSTNIYQGYVAASTAAPATTATPPRTLPGKESSAAVSATVSSRTPLSKEDQLKPKEPLSPVAPRPINSILSESSAGDSTIAAALPTMPIERREAINRPVIPTTPGAFAIPGANSATATVIHVADTIHENVEEEEEEDEEDVWNELDRILDVDDEEWNRLDKPNELKNQTVESNLIVAARLASDVEATIHDQVRKSILDQTPRADVVHVEHGSIAHKMEDPIAEAKRKADLERYKPRGVKEKLFGDGKTAMLDIGAAPDDYIRKRTLLPFTVKQNETTGNWVCSVQSNQKAWEKSQHGHNSASANLDLMRSVKTFSANTEKAAVEAGCAMAPPIMDSIDENPICNLCKTKFAVFRRPHHCRNCGVVVCSSCACSWSSRRLPSTYNTQKKEKVIVCQACDWLADEFQKAVMSGNMTKAMALYKTGNVNVRHPYGAWTKGGKEVFNPIHMSILGGNLDLVRWLIEERCCPLRRRDKAKSILSTSKGRSPLRLALTRDNPEILRYLVVEQGMSLGGEDLRGDYRHLLIHLTSLLNTVPDSMLRPKEESSDHSITIDLDKLNNSSLPNFARAATTEEKSMQKIKQDEIQVRRGSF